MTLGSGRQLWVSADFNPVDGGEPEPHAVSSMIEPLSPEQHGVIPPGVLLKGVHLSEGAA
jgi:hypothetical protein